MKNLSMWGVRNFTPCFRKKFAPNKEGIMLIKLLFYVTGVGLNNGSNSSHQLFHILHNLTQTKSPNLKYHVFDKMLSDELLSIKQHIYDKDGRYLSDHTVSKSNVPTPTLEIKQKWPVIEFLSNMNKIKETDQYVKQRNNVDNQLKPDYTETKERSTIAISTYIEKKNLSNAEQIKENEVRQKLFVQKIKGRKSLPKVIGLRSLYQNTDEHQLTNNRRCSCDSKSSATCEPQLAGSSTHKCTRCTHGVESSCDSACSQTTTPCPLTTCSHTSACATMPSSTLGDSCGKCTRLPCTSTGCSTRVSYTAFPFYMPFQYPMQTANPVAYYFTTQLEDYGFTREPKHRSTKRRKVDYYYYDDNSKEDDYLEYSIKKDTRPPIKGSCRDIVLKVDYTDKVQHRPNELCDGVYDVNKNKFLNEIVQDLKMYYPEAVVKDCYCKSSSVQSILSFYLIVIVFFFTFYFF